MLSWLWATDGLCLRWLHFKFYSGQLGPLTLSAIKIYCCPACPTGVDNMPQLGLALCLWRPDLVVTQETCQPPLKPYVKATFLNHISWQCVDFCSEPHAQLSLFSGVWLPATAVAEQSGYILKWPLSAYAKWLFGVSPFRIIKGSEKSACVSHKKEKLGRVQRLIIYSSFCVCRWKRDAKTGTKEL